MNFEPIIHVDTSSSMEWPRHLDTETIGLSPEEYEDVPARWRPTQGDCRFCRRGVFLDDRGLYRVWWDELDLAAQAYCQDSPDHLHHLDGDGYETPFSIVPDGVGWVVKIGDRQLKGRIELSERADDSLQFTTRMPGATIGHETLEDAARHLAEFQELYLRS